MFIFISGASASVARAGIMGILTILSIILSRKSNTINNICVSAIILLCINPLIIYDVGFMLSFAGTVGIVLLSKNVNETCRKFIKNKIISETIAVTISAQIILTPIMAYFFNNISLVSLVTNLLVVPISGMLTILGIITIFINMVSCSLARIIACSIYAIISFIIFIAKIFGNISWANLVIPTPKIWMVFLYYFLLFIYLYLKQKRKKIFYIIFCFISIFLILSKIPKNYIKLNMIDVGQGDSFYIETSKGKVILIDGGGSESSDYDVGENIVLPYLLDKGKKTIDLIIVSHPHEDHIEGIFTILKKLKVKNIVIGQNIEEFELTKELIRICEKKNINVIRVSKGDRLCIDGVNFEIMHPNKNFNNENINNMSLIVKMEYSQITALFTGDIEKNTESELIENIKANILKVSHHGSNTSSTEKFLKKVLPQISLISVGENNSYGHPSNEVIKRLEDMNNEIYRTDTMGEVKFKIYKNGKIKVSKTI